MMEDRRKIVIPTGAEEAEPLETPHFDTEAARAARPVVPLAATPALSDAELPPRSVHYTQSELPPRTRLSPWLLSLVILAAMSVGAALALALDYYRNHKSEDARPETHEVAQPSGATVVPDTRPAEKPIEQTRVVEPAAERAPVSMTRAQESPSPTPAPSAPVTATQKSPDAVARPKPGATVTPAREERKQDEPQTVARETRREKPPKDEEAQNDTEARRQARKQRRPQEIEVGPDSVTPQIKRASQELHRIREIFEGTRP